MASGNSFDDFTLTLARLQNATPEQRAESVLGDDWILSQVRTQAKQRAKSRRADQDDISQETLSLLSEEIRSKKIADRYFQGAFACRWKGIIRNKTLKAWRKLFGKLRHETAVNEEWEETCWAEDQELLDKRIDIDAAISRLEGVDRVLAEHLLNGKTAKYSAKFLGISEGHISRKRRKVLENLRQELGAEYSFEAALLDDSEPCLPP